MELSHPKIVRAFAHATTDYNANLNGVCTKQGFFLGSGCGAVGIAVSLSNIVKGNFIYYQLY